MFFYGYHTFCIGNIICEHFMRKKKKKKYHKIKSMVNKLKTDNILYSFKSFSTRYGSGERAVPIILRYPVMSEK